MLLLFLVNEIDFYQKEREREVLQNDTIFFKLIDHYSVLKKEKKKEEKKSIMLESQMWDLFLVILGYLTLQFGFKKCFEELDVNA